MSLPKCRMDYSSSKYQWVHPPTQKTRKKLLFDEPRLLKLNLNRKCQISSGKRTAVYTDLPAFTLGIFSVSFVICSIHLPQTSERMYLTLLFFFDSLHLHSTVQFVQPFPSIYSPGTPCPVIILIPSTQSSRIIRSIPASYYYLGLNGP
jgi:hypothetical protein